MTFSAFLWQQTASNIRSNTKLNNFHQFPKYICSTRLNSPFESEISCEISTCSWARMRLGHDFEIGCEIIWNWYTEPPEKSPEWRTFCLVGREAAIRHHMCNPWSPRRCNWWRKVDTNVRLTAPFWSVVNATKASRGSRAWIRSPR